MKRFALLCALLVLVTALPAVSWAGGGDCAWINLIQTYRTDENGIIFDPNGDPVPARNGVAIMWEQPSSGDLVVTYRFDNSFNALGGRATAIKNAIRAAAAVWTTGLTGVTRSIRFEENPSSPNVIYAETSWDRDPIGQYQDGTLIYEPAVTQKTVDSQDYIVSFTMTFNFDSSKGYGPDQWFDSGSCFNISNKPHSTHFVTLHEFGHALGLAHPNWGQELPGWDDRCDNRETIMIIPRPQGFCMKEPVCETDEKAVTELYWLIYGGSQLVAGAPTSPASVCGETDVDLYVSLSYSNFLTDPCNAAVTVDGIPAENQGGGWFHTYVPASWVGTIHVSESHVAWTNTIGGVPGGDTYVETVGVQGTYMFSGAYEELTVSGTVFNSPGPGTPVTFWGGVHGNCGWGLAVPFPVTDGSGHYSATVPYGWTGTINVNEACCYTSNDIVINTPLTQGLLNQNLTVQNFSSPGSVSGTVTENDGVTAIPGVNVTLYNYNNNLYATVQTDASGNYAFTNVPCGIYRRVAPTTAGYTWSPSSIDLSGTCVNGSTPQTNRNFSGTPLTHTLSGQLSNVDTGAHENGVTVKVDGVPAGTSAGLGSFAVEVGHGWQGTLSFEKACVGFFDYTPPSPITSDLYSGFHFGGLVSRTVFTAPLAGAVWNIGTAPTISWTHDCEPDQVEVHYSANDGATWTELVDGVDGTLTVGSTSGQFVWTTGPSVRTSAARIKLVTDINNTLFLWEETSQPFAVVCYDMYIATPLEGASWPVGTYQAVRARAPQACEAITMSFDLSRDGGTTWQPLGTDDTVPYEATWQVQPPLGSVVLRATATSAGETQVEQTTANVTPGFLETTPYDLTAVIPYGASWIDYDDDGDLDAMFARSGESELWENSGGNYAVVFSAGIAGPMAWADHDNDGDLDVYIGNASGANGLYDQLSDGTFTAVTGSPINDTGQTNAVTWIDYNEDGRVDMYVGNEGGPNKLYRNGGTDYFTDVTASSGLGNTGNTVAVAWADYNNDGYSDVYVANRDGGSALYRNAQQDGFALVTNSGITYSPSDAPVDVAWGDYDNDGDSDLMIALAASRDALFRNNGNGSFSPVTIGSSGTGDESSNHAAFFDYDNDGDLDYFVGASRCVPFDATNGNRIYQQLGVGQFVHVNEPVVSTPGECNYGVQYADADADGDVDILLPNTDMSIFGVLPAVAMITNYGDPGRNWLEIKLVGVASNKRAIGAEITISAGGKTQRRIVAGDGPLVAHFGLGSATVVNSLTVNWPSCRTSTLNNVAVNQLLTYTEPYLTPQCGGGGGGPCRGCPPPIQGTSTPTVTKLIGVTPNPFNPTTSIRFDLAAAENPIIAVYDVAGRLVRRVDLGPLGVGRHAWEWDGRTSRGEAVSSGVYFVVFKAGGVVQRTKAVMLK